MGTPEFAVPSLRALLRSEHEVVAVITQPDRPKGRHLHLSPSLVKELALENHLTLLQPPTLNDESFKRKIDELRPDLVIVVAYGQIIPGWLLRLPRYGCVNVHASLLPRYRGAAPIQRVIMDGCEITGVTMMFMDEGLDTGDILLQSAIPIAPDDTAGDLSEKLSRLGAELLLTTIEGLSREAITPVVQDERLATHAPKVEKEEALIDWSLSAESIRNLIRALNPQPGAYTFYRGKRLKIWEALSGESSREDLKPGIVFDVDARKGFVVGCGQGELLVSRVQLEGKQAMTATEFCRGHEVKVGEKLGSKLLRF